MRSSSDVLHLHFQNPRPNGKYDHRYELSKHLMKRDPVRIAQALKQWVTDGPHQLSVFRHIRDHFDRGATLWHFDRPVTAC